MKSPDSKSGFRLIGSPEQVAHNKWFDLKKQVIDFVDPNTDEVKHHGEMNYVDIRPGVNIVGETTTGKTILIPQERHVTNIVEERSGRGPARHYEFPAGGIEKEPDDIKPSDVIAAAERELGEEAGVKADDYIILGPQDRGLINDAGISTRHTYTVLARGIQPRENGPDHEATEHIGDREEFFWPEVDDMHLNPEGLWTPNGYKIISSMATVSSAGLAQAWLRRHNEHRPKHF